MTSEVFKNVLSHKSSHLTLLTAEIIKWQKCAHMGLNGFHIAIEKIKILGAPWELPAKQHCQFGQFGPNLR